MLALSAMLWALVACAAREGDRDQVNDERSVTETPEANGRNLPALGQPLMIALAQARNHHHKADVYLKEANLAQAIAAVRAIEEVPFPEGAAEAEDVKLDARARLAKLLVTSGQLDEAMTVVDTGIARATRDSFFVANLHTVKGEVYEARANVLDDDPSEDAKVRARQARMQAIESFDRSIAINTELQKALMNESKP